MALIREYNILPAAVAIGVINNVMQASQLICGGADAGCQTRP